MRVNNHDYMAAFFCAAMGLIQAKGGADPYGIAKTSRLLANAMILELKQVKSLEDEDGEGR